MNLKFILENPLVKVFLNRLLLRDMTSKKIIFLIIGAAFLVRILGINYGLPLWLVADEPPFIFGALKMIELKTLIPALHSGEFEAALYYPPYIPYFYLIPFGIFLGLKYLFIGGGLESFKNIIVADPSRLFMIARFLMAILGTATIWLVYKISKNIFKSEAGALLSAGFLAFSFIHANFSHWGRHWIPVAFVFSLVIYVLSREDFSLKKKYLSASLIAGIGAGVNYQSAVSIIFILLWFIFYDRLLSAKIFREKWIYASIALFLVLILLAYFLYPAGFVVGKKSIVGERNLSGFLGGYIFHATNLFYNDPAILLFTVLGLILSFFYGRKYFLVATGFIFSYIAVFYILVFHVDRYILMLLPLFAITAGYGLLKLWEKINVKFKFLVIGLGIISFVFPAAMIIKFDWLLLRNDIRIQVINWVESSIPKNSKIAILASFMRMPTTPEAIKELKKIDKNALRQVDFVESALKNRGDYYNLNLYTASSDDFYGKIKKYLKENHYEYLIVENAFAKEKGVNDVKKIGTAIKIFDGYTDEAKDLVNWFGGGDKNSYGTVPWFIGGWKNIFKLKNNGPQIIILKL
jgi:hypothetical protein